MTENPQNTRFDNNSDRYRIELDGVWKIFGASAKAAMKAVQERGLDQI